MSKELFYYVQDTRQVVGNCALWWREDNNGYTVNLADAKIFTKEEAFKIHKNRNTDVPRSHAKMLSIAKLHVNVEDMIG